MEFGEVLMFTARVNYIRFEDAIFSDIWIPWIITIFFLAVWLFTRRGSGADARKGAEAIPVAGLTGAILVGLTSIGLTIQALSNHLSN